MLEEKYTEIEGYRVHYWEGGEGYPVLMLHGVGPGTSVVGNFGPVLEPMAERYHIIACDLIGFAESGRKREEPYFDVELWVRQGLAMLDLLPGGPCGVAGHSLGGALALKVTARSDRVERVLTSCPLGVAIPLNASIDAFWNLPADRDALRRAMRDMVGDPEAVTDEMIEGRWDLLSQPGYGEYFGAMFGGDRQRYIDEGEVTADEFARIKATAMMIHGREDKPCPPDQTTMIMAESLTQAEIRLIPNCGHNLPREQTDAYLDAAFSLFG